jgi:hypothetical protein
MLLDERKRIGEKIDRRAHQSDVGGNGPPSPPKPSRFGDPGCFDSRTCF